MTVDKHDLVHEFPEYRERIHALKLSDAHFAKAFSEYHDLDHEIRRIEQGVETPGDDYIEQQKQKRVHLKDRLYDMLKAEA